MQEKMTKTLKEKWVERILISTASVAVSLIVYSFTFTHDTNYTEQKELKETVIRLDKDKAGIDYVDKKCLEVKKEMEDRQTQTNVRLTNIENTTQNIYNYLLNQKK